MFLLVPAYPGCLGQTAVKCLLLFVVVVIANTVEFSILSSDTIFSTVIAVSLVINYMTYLDLLRFVIF